MSPILLSMQGVSKRFGATQALKDVSLSVRAGEVMALVGENGAGKSTLMKVLSGAHVPDSGTMELAGRPFAPRGPHHARLAGIAMIYQELTLCPDLSVEDNVMLGQERHAWGWLRRAEQRRRVQDVLALLGHPELRPQAPVKQLSIGAQQLVEIARALVLDAKVIVFDEPTSSLAAQDVERLFEVIRKLRASGLGVIYISHFLEEVRAICDRCTVLRDGQVAGVLDLVKQVANLPSLVIDGQVSNLPHEACPTDANIVALMVGRSVDELFPQVPHEAGEVILSLRGLCGEPLPKEISFDLRRGEILGIAGLVGAGRTELLRALFGLDPVRRGQVRVASFLRQPGPRAMIRAGMGFVSEDRKGEGLAQNRSIEDNVTYSRLGPYSWLGWLNLGRRRAAVADWMQHLQIRATSPEQEVQSLSGGNQQKVALARVLHQQAEILLLDEPTRGIDVGTKAEIYRLMGEAAAAGKAILFVSSYLPELLAVCDRLGVMSRGHLREIRPVREWTEEQVMACAVA